MSNLSTVPEQKRYGLIKPMGVTSSSAGRPQQAPVARAPPSSAAVMRAFAADDDEDAFDEEEEGQGARGRGRGGGGANSARSEVSRVNREILARSAATAAAIDLNNAGAGASGGGGDDYLDYDSAYDSMKQQQADTHSAMASKLSLAGQANGGGPKVEARYIANIKAMAAIREKEQDRLYERRMAKERAEEEAAMGADAADATPKFVTAAYRAKLAEAQKWEAADKAAQEQEERQAEMQRKEGGLTSFYSNLLTKNLAFGSADAASASVSVYTAGGANQAKLLSSGGDAGSAPAKTSSTSHDKASPGTSEDKEKRKRRSPSPEPIAPAADAASSSTTTVPKAVPSSHTATVAAAPAAVVSAKEKEDAVAAARQRFLERKKAKVE